MRLIRSISPCCFMFLLSASILGCGSGKPSAVPVTGVVTLDGNPVEKAAVMLMPTDSKTGGQPSSGLTDGQGKFTLKTEKVGPGVLPGSYQATVIKKETSGILPGQNGLDGGIAPGGIKEKWIIPKKYSLPNESGLKVEVKSGMEPVKFELKSK